MAAASSDLDFRRRMPVVQPTYGFAVKGGVRIFKRAIVGITSAKLAVPAGTSGCVALIGLSQFHVDNRTGGDGATEPGDIDKGIFLMPVPAATPADIRSTVYALDDQTLQLTNANGALPLGIIDAIDAEGVWVRI